MLRMVVVLGAVGLGALGCGDDCRSRGEPSRRNVVFVTLDTLRADHLGSYGSTKVRTPSLDRLAEEGALFERCHSQTHVTVPSHVSLFTSLPLAQHGVLSNDGDLDRALEGMVHRFKQASYRTAAVVSAKHLGPEFAVGRALPDLDLYDAPRRVSKPYRASETNRRLFRWMEGVCGEPFFVWVHYWDAHMPYTPPAPFDRAYYPGDPYDTGNTSMKQVKLAWHFYDLRRMRKHLAPREAEISRLSSELGIEWKQLKELILNPEAQAPGLTEGVRARLRDLEVFARERLPFHPDLAAFLTGVTDFEFPLAQYAAEVAYLDSEIGKLHAKLESLGIADRTIVVITADHGESFGEHGVYLDHTGLYEQNLHVPLIIWAPGLVAPGRYPEPVRGLDVAPTVLGLAGLPVVPTMQGDDLFDAARRARFVVESNRGRQLAILSGRWKLIETLLTFRYSDIFGGEQGAIELYDLARDPGERRSIAKDEPGVVMELRRELQRWQARQAELLSEARRGDGGGGPLSPRQRESLRALGYVE